MKSKADVMFAIECLPPKGQYTHNLVSLYLRRLMVTQGKEIANEVVRELKLTKRYGITEVA